jgi:hypothetical protein
MGGRCDVSGSSCFLVDSEHRPQLASPGLIWFRAQIVRKAWQKERIERPLVVMRGLAGLTGAVILLLLVAGKGQMQDAMDHRSWFLLPLLLLTITASLASGAILLWSTAKR